MGGERRKNRSWSSLSLRQGRSGCSKRCSPGWTVTSAAERSSCQPHTLEPAADGHLWSKSNPKPRHNLSLLQDLLASLLPPTNTCLIPVVPPHLVLGLGRGRPTTFQLPSPCWETPRAEKESRGTVVTAVLRLPGTCWEEALRKRSISAALPRPNSSRPGYLRVLAQHPSPAFSVQLRNETSLKYSQAMLLCRKMPAWPAAALPRQG